MGPRTPLPTDALKFFVASQTMSFLQPSTYGSLDVPVYGLGRCHRFPQVPVAPYRLLSMLLHDQSLSSLKSTGLDDPASALGAHPSPKTVNSLTSSFLGLIGTLGH